MKERLLSPSVITALVLAAGAVVCTVMWTGALITAKRGDDVIRVVGSARKSIRSDFIIWNGTVTENSPSVAQGYASLTRKMALVKQYLQGKGIAESDVRPLAINVETLYAPPKRSPDGEVLESENTFRPIVGYRLRQGIEIQSGKVELVERISRQSTELVGKGVVIESSAPLYLYTKMSELKVSMQAEAAKDARQRAEQIAINSGCRLGQVRFARMQVPSITPLYSANESDGGVDDTTALDKKITAIVVVGYAVR